MKKISTKQYAVALYEASKGKKGAELNVVFTNFLKLVRKNKDWKNLNKIVKRFEEVYCQEEGLAEVIVSTSRKISDPVLNNIKKWLEAYIGKTVTLKTKIDELLIGGMVVEYEDTILDASLSTKLKKLNNTLTK